MELTFAATSPRWASRSVIFALLSYPFHQCDCVRVQAVTSTANERAISALERIGFQREGTLRKAHRDGDAYVYGLLRDEWELSPYGLAKPASST